MVLVHQRGWDAGIFATSPWFAVLGNVSGAFLAHGSFPTLDALNALLTRAHLAAGLPNLQAVYSPPKTTHRKKRKAPIDPSSLYDVRIAEHRELPTRLADWHDFFNVLAFAAWPRSKHALHTRQSRLLRARLAPDSRRLPGARTREQDALTLLDEGGVIVACDRTAYAHLSPHQHARADAFAECLRACIAAGTAQLVPFGHALFEHLAAGLPCPLAIPQRVMLTDGPLRDLNCLTRLDGALATQLEDATQFLMPSGVKGLMLDHYTAPFTPGQKLVPRGVADYPEAEPAAPSGSDARSERNQ
jgi:hypothetical protein